MEKLKKLYIIVFVLICFLPLILMPFVKNKAQIEKRELKKFPVFAENGMFNSVFADEFEAWFNDRLPFRAQLLTVSNFVKSEIFKAPSSSVLMGINGWLFYEPEKYDYMYANPLSDSQVKAIGVTLSLIEESIKEKGGNFTFAPVPDKASVYEEFFPRRYQKSSENNLTKVLKVLDEMNVNHVNLLKIMRDNKDKGLYHKRDSHWNYQGALIGYNAIMDSLNKEHKTYSDATYTIKKNWRGDLDKLLYPLGTFLDDQYVYNIDFSSFRFDGVRGSSLDAKEQLENFMSDKEQGDDEFKSINTNVASDRKLFMARDSFARALLPYFIDNYNEATFKRTDNPDIVYIDDNTDMVYEVAERNINRIIITAPFVYAPIRENFDVSNLVPAGNVEMSKFSHEGYATRIYGKLDESTNMEDGRVYAMLSNDNHTVVYEAFPIFERNLLEAVGTKGYSLYINPEDDLNGKYDVNIIVGVKSYYAGHVFFNKTNDEKEKANNDINNTIINNEASKYSIIYNGIEFSVGDEFNTIKNYLGEEIKPSESFRACSPGVKGETTEYFYDGITILANYQGIINYISFESDIPSFVCGVKVGQTIDEIKTILGEGSEDEYSINYKDGEDVYINILKNDDGTANIISIEDMSIEV